MVKIKSQDDMIEQNKNGERDEYTTNWKQPHFEYGNIFGGGKSYDEIIGTPPLTHLVMIDSTLYPPPASANPHEKKSNLTILFFLYNPLQLHHKHTIL